MISLRTLWSGRRRLLDLKNSEFSSRRLLLPLSSASSSSASISTLPEITSVQEPPSTASEEFVQHWNQHCLTEDQQQFQRLASDFAQKELIPFAAEWDKHKHFPVDVIRRAANLGFGGIFCGEDVGGIGLSRSDGAIIFEAMAYGDVSTTAYLTIHNMCCGIVDRFGTAEQRETWLPSLTNMVGARDLTLASVQLLMKMSYVGNGVQNGNKLDSRYGTLVSSQKSKYAVTTHIPELTTARRDAGKGDYILTGEKAFVSGGGHSDVYLVMARTGAEGPKGISCFIVEKDMPGLSFGREEDKMGWRSQPTAGVILEGVRVPERNRLGVEGQGFKIALTGLDGGRINIGSCSVGGAQFCLDAAQAYVSTRKQFGKAIIDFQNTQFKLADMATSVMASRLMVANAASAFDANVPWVTPAAAMAKRFATDKCFHVCSDALQLLGGYGYLKDYSIERYVRDLRVHMILEGTNEIMRAIIARHMIKNKA